MVVSRVVAGARWSHVRQRAHDALGTGWPDTADLRRVRDRAYEKIATELNCCGCYLGCVMVPVIAVSTGLLVVSDLV